MLIIKHQKDIIIHKDVKIINEDTHLLSSHKFETKVDLILGSLFS